jgi:hypothetical protein
MLAGMLDNLPELPSLNSNIRVQIFQGFSINTVAHDMKFTEFPTLNQSSSAWGYKEASKMGHARTAHWTGGTMSALASAAAAVLLEYRSPTRQLMRACAGASQIHSASAQGAELSRPALSSDLPSVHYVYSPSGTPSAFRYSTCMQGVN